MKKNRLGAEKLFYHLEKILEIKETGGCYPIHAQIGLTEYCCHKCVFCYSEFATADTAVNATLDRKVLLKYLKNAKECGLKSVTLVGSGEPLLHPEIEKILYDIHELGIEIGLFTNGARALQSVRKAILETCTFVRFSINGYDRESFKLVHRVDGFDEVLNNVRSMVNERKRQFPTIGTQLVFYEDNYRGMVEATKLWKEIGVDYFEIKPVIAGEGNSVNQVIFPAKDANQVHRLMEECRRYEDDNFSVYAKEKQYLVTITDEKRGYDTCFAHNLDTDVWADGSVRFCVNHCQEEDIIGNIYSDTFEEIWNGLKRKERIKKICVDNCPKSCIGHWKNEIIWDCMNPDPEMHPNFV